LENLQYFKNKGSSLHDLSPAKLAAFIIISALLIISWILLCFPVLNRELFSYNSSINVSGNRTSGDFDDNVPVYPGDNDSGQINTYNKEGLAVIEIVTDEPVVPQIGDYLVIAMTAKNTGQVAYPAGSFSINLGKLLTLNQEGFEGTDSEFSVYDRTAFYIDGINHTYYVPLGENRNYRYHYIPGKLVLKKEIGSIEIEIPPIEGVDINISKITVAKRALIPLDGHINYFLKNSLNIKNINRYFTPAYIFIIVALILYAVYMLLARSAAGKKIDQGDGSPASILLYGSKQNKSNGSKNAKNGLVIVMLLIPLLSFFYFIATKTLFNVKSYWDSYKKYIIEGRLNEAYYGFYNFEKFISWVDENTEQGQNIAVLVRGEPVYIMAEMAYNLYPRDIKFIDISGKTRTEIEKDIEELSQAPGRYNYLIILSEEDKIISEKLRLVLSYKQTGGFLYKLK
jgi:hypothetical protein